MSNFKAGDYVTVLPSDKTNGIPRKDYEAAVGNIYRVSRAGAYNCVLAGAPNSLGGDGYDWLWANPNLEIAKIKTEESPLVQSFRELMEENIATVAKKNADYSGADSDGFKNFELVEQLGICSTEVGFLVRMCDKLARLSTLVGSETGPQVADESIEDTLGDLANYASLMQLYRRKP